MNITLKMTFYTVSVLAMVFGLLLMMNHFKFGNILRDVTTSRLAVINNNLQAPFSKATDLGLALDELSSANDWLRHAKAGDPAILRIEVFDTGGQILYSTEPGAVGRKVSAEFLDNIPQHRADTNGSWTISGESRFVNGVTLFNSFDRPVGGIAMHYDNTAYRTLVGGMLQNLSTVTGIVLALAAVVAFAGVFFGFRELRGTFTAMQNALQQVKAIPAEAEAAEGDETADEFQQKLRTVSRNVQQALRNIEETVPDPGRST